MSTQSALPTDFFDGVGEGGAVLQVPPAANDTRSQDLDEFFSEVGVVQPRIVSHEMEERIEGEHEEAEEAAAQYSYLLRVAGLQQKKGHLDGDSANISSAPSVKEKDIKSSNKRKASESTTAEDLLCFSF